MNDDEFKAGVAAALLKSKEPKMDQSAPPIPPTLGTPAQRALIEPLFRAHARGGLTLHAAINSVVILANGAMFRRSDPAPPSATAAAPTLEPGLPSHPTAEDILTRLETHRLWCDEMSHKLWDEHARAAMRQAANNFEIAIGYIREKPNDSTTEHKPT